MEGENTTNSVSDSSVPMDLHSKLAEMEALVAKKDSAIKLMQTRTKEYISSIDSRYKEQINSLTEQLSSSRGMCEQLESDNRELETQLSDIRSQYHESVRSLEKQKEEITQLKENLSVSRQESEAALLVARREKSAADGLRHQLENITKEYRELHNRTTASSGEHLKTIETLRSELSQLRATESKLRENIRSLEQKHEDRDNEVNQILSSAADSSSQIRSLQAQISSLTVRNASLESEVSLLTSEAASFRQESEKHLTSLRTLTSTNQALLAKCDESNARLAAMQKQWAAAKADWAAARTRFEEALSARNADRDHLQLELRRLERSLEEGQVEVRRARAAAKDAEAAARSSHVRQQELEVQVQELTLKVAEAQRNGGDDLKAELESKHRDLTEDLVAAQSKCQALSDALADAERRAGEAEEALNVADQLRLEAEQKMHQLAAETEEAKQQLAQETRKRLAAKRELLQSSENAEKERSANLEILVFFLCELMPRLSIFCGAACALCRRLQEGFADPAALGAADMEFDAILRSLGGREGGGGSWLNPIESAEALAKRIHLSMYNVARSSASGLGSASSQTSSSEVGEKAEEDQFVTYRNNLGQIVKMRVPPRSSLPILEKTRLLAPESPKIVQISRTFLDTLQATIFDATRFSAQLDKSALVTAQVSGLDGLASPPQWPQGAAATANRASGRTYVTPTQGPHTRYNPMFDADGDPIPVAGFANMSACLAWFSPPSLSNYSTPTASLPSNANNVNIGSTVYHASSGLSSVQANRSSVRRGSASSEDEVISSRNPNSTGRIIMGTGSNLPDRISIS